MEVYIEYALIENFCVDLSILYLALKCARLSARKYRVIFSAVLGACFAVIFPFLTVLGEVVCGVLKALYPLLLCFVAFDRKDKKGGGRYALFALFFYLVSFAFAGGTYAFCAVFNVSYAFGNGLLTQAPIGLLFSAFVGVGALLLSLCKKLYERREKLRFIYPCEISFNGKTLKTKGFVDSGNVVKKEGNPVCFLSAELFFELFGAESFSDVFEETAVTTVAGSKKIKIAKLDEIKIYCGKLPNIIKKPYCSPSYTFRAREYKVLLGAWALQGENGEQTEV